MNRIALQEQRNRLYVIWDTARSEANEFRSVGMEPPKENVSKLKAIARKLERLARQLKIEWDE